ncbi:MAG: zinc-binding dehydrogenase, partial [Verrucomicrobiota bacterium]
MDLPSPFIVGCDFAGRVLQVGSQVTQFKPGDRVWGSNQGLLGRQGTFAERIAIDAQWAYKLPDEVSFESAAAVALVGITAHLGLFAEAGLQAGQTLFIPGGSGGVGSMVVQMASLHGAKVITTAGSPGKAERWRELGAAVVLLSRVRSV